MLAFSASKPHTKSKTLQRQGPTARLHNSMKRRRRDPAWQLNFIRTSSLKLVSVRDPTALKLLEQLKRPQASENSDAAKQRKHSQDVKHTSGKFSRTCSHNCSLQGGQHRYQVEIESANYLCSPGCDVSGCSRQRRKLRQALQRLVRR